MLHLEDHFAGYHLLVRDDLVDRVDRSAGNAGVVKHLLPLFSGFGHESFRQNRTQSRIVLIAQRVGLEARVIREVKLHQAAKGHPKAVVAGCQHDRSGEGVERLKRHDRRMAIADRVRDFTGEFEAGDGVFEDGNLAVEHGNVYHLPHA